MTVYLVTLFIMCTRIPQTPSVFFFFFFGVSFFFLLVITAHPGRQAALWAAMAATRRLGRIGARLALLVAVRRTAVVFACLLGARVTRPRTESRGAGTHLCAHLCRVRRGLLEADCRGLGSHPSRRCARRRR